MTYECSEMTEPDWTVVPFLTVLDGGGTIGGPYTRWLPVGAVLPGSLEAQGGYPRGVVGTEDLTGTSEGGSGFTDENLEGAHHRLS